MPPLARATTSPDARFAPPAAQATRRIPVSSTTLPDLAPATLNARGKPNRTCSSPQAARARIRPPPHACSSPPRATSTCAPIADGLHPVSARVEGLAPVRRAAKGARGRLFSRGCCGLVRAARPRLSACEPIGAAQRTRRGELNRSSRRGSTRLAVHRRRAARAPWPRRRCPSACRGGRRARPCGRPS